MNNTKYKSFIALILITALCIANGCTNDKESALDHYKYISPSGSSAGSGSFQDNEIAVEAPPFTDGIFPCTDCHSDMEANPDRRPLVDMHDDIDAMFDHDSDNRWCLDCHDIDNRDFLRLASGKLVSFDESYKLCGQCHGDKLRDWKVGIHGKRTGEWNGQKQYFLCVHCHNPHSPAFEPLTPMPPPARQEDMYR